ncbi:PREDICTED: uncharacterized protein LOC100639595 [Amphimedon queenslandica]|uniref:Death domain-containing protein n=1 Tax=Amphimedon queenslandica TaxID=400682 RepID=A0A1X7VQ65_AMPQE|nr:PREDICTED: uncharacterized protein LOC100639595 [Amphimedon queenslandica]|eukprot:XP_003383284.1 PREDICTED: uncharacterized protein LOC100639595 [Amphimedon queenslandica]
MAALDEKPTDLDCAHYSKVINTWELLATFLKITDPDITALKRDFPDYNQQKIQMLFLWRRKNGRRATRRVLAEACRNAEEVTLAEKIEGKPESEVVASEPVLAAPIQATSTDLSSSSAPTHLSYREPTQAQDDFPEGQ